MNPLQIFYTNEVEREAVKAFLLQEMRELAANYAVDGEPTHGIKPATECIENAFARLEEMFKKPLENPIPNAR